MQAVPYVKTEDFTDYATDNPQAPYPPAKIDSQLALIAQFSAAIQENIFKIQRDDGGLRNGVVHPQSLSASTLALIDSEFTPRGQWTTGVAYKAKDVLENVATEDLVFVVSDHTSGVYATDLAAGKLMRVGKTSSATTDAQNVSYTPTGSNLISQVQMQLVVQQIQTLIEALQTFDNAVDARLDAAEVDIDALQLQAANIPKISYLFAYCNSSTPTTSINIANTKIPFNRIEYSESFASSTPNFTLSSGSIISNNNAGGYYKYTIGINLNAIAADLVLRFFVDGVEQNSVGKVGNSNEIIMTGVFQLQGNSTLEVFATDSANGGAALFTVAPSKRNFILLESLDLFE